jgi:protein SCO1
MLRSALPSLVLALAGYGSAAWLTHDFQIWTAEGARRLEVALAPVAAPAVQIDGPGITPQPLAQWLADGQSVTLLNFVYTRCETVCLALGSVYQQLQATLQAARKTDASAQHVRLLSISFDGERDSPQLLEDYAARLGADASVWQFARVPDAQENQRLLADFQVVVVPDGRSGFEHNAALLVLDQQGRLVRIFDVAEQQLALDYARYLAGRSEP